MVSTSFRTFQVSIWNLARMFAEGQQQRNMARLARNVAAGRLRCRVRVHHPAYAFTVSSETRPLAASLIA